MRWESTWGFCQFIEEFFRETKEPAVRGANVNVGQQPLRVNGVKVYTENVNRRQIPLGLQTSFAGGCKIDLEIKRYSCGAGVSSIQIDGTMWVTREPLMGDMPLVFLLGKPSLGLTGQD